VKPESKLYQKFKKNTPSILWTRLESWSSFGVPDLLGYNNLCGFFMVELKFTHKDKQTGEEFKAVEGVHCLNCMSKLTLDFRNQFNTNYCADC